MKGGMGILHHLFPSELGEGGMLKIGTGALAGQRARNATAEAHQSCCVLATPGTGQGQQFTAIPKVIGATCGLTSLKGHLLLCVSLTQHKEGCWWDLIFNLAEKNTSGQCRALNKNTWASSTRKILLWQSSLCKWCSV